MNVHRAIINFSGRNLLKCIKLSRMANADNNGEVLYWDTNYQ